MDALLGALGRGTYTQRGCCDFDGYRKLLLGQVDAMIEPGIQAWDICPAAVLVRGDGRSGFRGNGLDYSGTAIAAMGAFTMRSSPRQASRRMIIPAIARRRRRRRCPLGWAATRTVDAALNALEQGEDVVDAAIAATKVLEDDPRFNAGTGSKIRLDGESIPARCIAHAFVGAFRRRRGPRTREESHPRRPRGVRKPPPDRRRRRRGLARRIGLAEHDVSTDDARASVAEVREALSGGRREWAAYDWRRAWDYDGSLEAAGLSRHTVGTDTVGCCVRDAHGNFAAALSTGGTSTTLRGRVGDVPILGAGLYASPSAAVACTGGRRTHS
ncbi:MAG: isoaspartyl peptidase/L-asparaginase [Polyangiales bacterium]